MQPLNEVFIATITGMTIYSQNLHTFKVIFKVTIYPKSIYSKFGLTPNF